MCFTIIVSHGVCYIVVFQEQLAPNVMQMVRAFNRLALLTTTEVLSRETPQLRAKVITAYLLVSPSLALLHSQ